MKKFDHSKLHLKKEDGCGGEIPCSRRIPIRKYLGYWVCICGKLIAK